MIDACVWNAAELWMLVAVELLTRMRLAIGCVCAVLCRCGPGGCLD